MRRTVAFVVLGSMAITGGCAGRTPNPVPAYQYGDEKKSCERLAAEISQTEADIAAKLPKSDKTGSNVALGVAGAFLLVPWFFMDFSEADKVEVEALRRRYNNLVNISADKECALSYDVLPPFPEKTPSAPPTRPGD